MTKPRFENDPLELDRFKSQINLAHYAMSYGYKPVGNNVSPDRMPITLKNEATGHKIAVHKEGNGHYTYKALNGGNDKGTIIDFAQACHGYTSMGEVRKHLRDYSPALRDDRPQHAILLQTATRDRSALIRRYATMPGITHEGGHAYLARRGLGVDVLTHPRFHQPHTHRREGRSHFPPLPIKRAYRVTR